MDIFKIHGESWVKLMETLQILDVMLRVLNKIKTKSEQKVK